MEENPIIGYLKVAFIAVLVFVIFLAVWQGSKTEEKMVVIDRSVADLERAVRDLSRNVGEQRSNLDNLSGANEALLKLIARGGVRAPSGGTNGAGLPEAVTLGADDWGRRFNARLDANLDPKRPVGKPGRYKNYLRPDPYGHEVSEEEAPNTNGVLRRPWSQEPKGFNFLIESYATLSQQVEEYVLSRPGRHHKMRPSSFNWKPVLAWRIEVSPDYSEYTIYLRRDIYWHPVQADTRTYPHLDGRHRITAHDFKFTYDIIKDPQSNVADKRTYYKDLRNVEVIDDYTFVMRWEPNTFDSLQYSIRGHVMPRFIYAFDETGKEYLKETVAQEFNEHWYDRLRVGVVGTGPYRFTRYVPNKYIRLERWDEWFGFKEEPLYPVQALHYKIYTQAESMMTWMRAGEIDIGGLTSARYREWVLEETDPKSPFKDGRILTEIAPTTSYVYIGWKNSDPMFADKRVRQALTYACDRKEICKKIFLNRYEPMASPVWPHSEEADPDLEPYPFDPEKAKRLLDAAGWKMNKQTGLREKVIDGKSTQFEFKLHWPGPSPEFQNMLDHYKNDLLKIGIRMEPLSTQWASFQKDLQDRKFNAYSLGWATDGWEHDFKQIWHSREIKDPGSSNSIEFSNPEVDRLQDELDKTMDPKRRVEIIHKIGRILYEEQPYTFFGWRNVFMCHWNRVGNWKHYKHYARPLLRTFPLWIER